MPSLLVGGALSTLPKFRGPISRPKKSGPKKSKKKLKNQFFVAISKTRPVFHFDHFFRGRPPNPLVHNKNTEGGRKKEEGRRKKEEGRRKKEEGRRKKDFNRDLAVPSSDVKNNNF